MVLCGFITHQAEFMLHEGWVTMARLSVIRRPIFLLMVFAAVSQKAVLIAVLFKLLCLPWPNQRRDGCIFFVHVGVENGGRRLIQ